MLVGRTQHHGGNHHVVYEINVVPQRACLKIAVA